MTRPGNRFSDETITAALRPFAVSRETRGGLERYVETLLAWQERTNLVAPSTLDDLWQRHVADSLALTPFLPPCRVLDLGSGGGFPGIVLAVLWRGEPQAHVTMVESLARKTAFLRRALRETGGNGTVLDRRIETLDPAETGPVDCVTARALADLPTLCALAAPFLERGARALFHKGADVDREIADVPPALRKSLVKHPHPIFSGSVIVEIQPMAAARD